MKDFDGVDYLDKAESKAQIALEKLAAKAVITVSSNDGNTFLCFAMNGKKFGLNEKNDEHSIFKKAMKENVLIFKKHLAEKWMEELENDY